MDVKIGKYDMEFLENKAINKLVKMKYIEEYFKNKKHIHDTELKNKINKKEAFTMSISSAIVILISYTMVVIVAPSVKQCTSSISQEIQNDK